MCEHISVMRLGEVVETMPVERQRRQEPEHPYTQQFFRAAEGYDPEIVKNVDATL